jgi:hypothetical protein
MQAHGLTLSHAHPHRQALDPIQPMNALPVHVLTLASEHGVNAPVAKSQSCVGDIADTDLPVRTDRACGLAGNTLPMRISPADALVPS